MRANGLGGRDDLFVGRIQPAVADVVHDRAGENEAVLQHDAHLGAQGVQRHLGDVVAVNQHAAGIDVVEARDQVHDRRLARAGRADKRDRLARLDVEVEVLEMLTVPSYENVTSSNVTLPRISGSVSASGASSTVTGSSDHLKDALEVRHGVDEGIVEVRKLEDRLPEAPRVGGRSRSAYRSAPRGRAAKGRSGTSRRRPTSRCCRPRPKPGSGVLRLHPALVHFGVERVVDFRVLLLARVNACVIFMPSRLSCR